MCTRVVVFSLFFLFLQTCFCEVRVYKFLHGTSTSVSIVSPLRPCISVCVLNSGENRAHTPQLVWMKSRTLSRVVEACLSVMADTADEDVEVMVERTVRILDSIIYLTGALVLIFLVK